MGTPALEYLIVKQLGTPILVERTARHDHVVAAVPPRMA